MKCCEYIQKVNKALFKIDQVYHDNFVGSTGFLRERKKSSCLTHIYVYINVSSYLYVKLFKPVLELYETVVVNIILKVDGK